MADVASNLSAWSTTESSNAPSGSTAVGTGLDDNLRRIQATVRQDLANAASDVASASSTDIGAVASNYCRITGTTAITGLGTVSAGIWKYVRFAGALTLTHNATSLILPGAANITTAADDVGIFVSEGSGNWRCLSYTPAATAAIASTAAEQATGTTITRVVTPGRQQSHPSAAKAWAVFNGTSSSPITKDDGYNISGTITKNGTGDYTITFSTAFSTANYVLAGTATGSASGNNQVTVEALTNTTTTCRFQVKQGTALADRSMVMVVFYGTQ